MTIETMKLALEVLELINLEFVCANGSHHAKKDRHEWDEDCPITDRWRKAITALRTAIEQAEKQEPVKLRRGDVLRCIETDELCTVWATSTTGKTLVKWSANNFGDYTAEQIGELFWIEPAPVQEPVEFGMHGEKMMFKVGAQQFTLDYEPDTQDEFNFMRDMLIHAFSTFTHGVKTTPPAAQPAPVQEPVAWIEHEWSGSGLRHLHFERREQSVRDEVMNPIWTPLYTAPPAAQRQWVGLSEDEIDKLKHMIDWTAHWSHGRFAYEIEQLLKEKNQ